MKKRLLSLLLVAVLSLSFSGCSFINLDVETQLRSPHAAGEQSEIQTALEQHIYSENLKEQETEPVSYVLKYPKMGDYRSAFVMKDMNGDGTEDALAFYALQPEGANTHIALLCKRDGVWQCVDDIEGLATEIDRIHFGDLNGDRLPELFAGFSMYNTRDRRLMLYTWSDDHFVERYSDTYTNMIVEKFVSDEQDDLLLFRLNAEKSEATVRLLSMIDDAVIERGSAAIDGHISQFGPYTFTAFDEDVRGIVQDCYKDSQTTITELIVWDGERLTVPLYDPAENITTFSARESALPSVDIDLDGEIEWPQSFRMTGDELTKTEDMTLWMSDWYAWDQQEMSPVKKMTNIVNRTDGYYLIVPEEWRQTITAAYDEEQHRLTVKHVVNGVVGDELFDIVAFSASDSNPFEGEEYLFLASNDKMRYEIRYVKNDDFPLSMEKLTSLFELCDIQQQKGGN